MIKKLLRIKKNKGMSYVELVVVLGIFSVMSSIILFNYSSFQSKIDVKNLASDITLQVVQAQRSSMSGILPPPAQLSQVTSLWKPSYGVYFNRITDNKSFIYFTDINQNGTLDDLTCAGNGECLNKITITKGSTISSIDVFYQGDATAHSIGDVTISFLRPSSVAVIKSSASFSSTVSYIQITVLSPRGASAKILIYPAGRFQVK